MITQIKKHRLQRLSIGILYFLFLSVVCFAQYEEEETKEAQEIIKSAQVAYTAAALRDPFVSGLFGTSTRGQQAQDQTVAAPNLLVQGMVWESQLPQAIIDDQVVRVGDTVKEAKIIGIDKDGVLVSFQGRLFIGIPGGTFQPSGAKGVPKETTEEKQGE